MANVTRVNDAVTAARKVEDKAMASLLVLEQMYAYFSFDKLPMERAELPRAA